MIEANTGTLLSVFEDRRDAEARAEAMNDEDNGYSYAVEPYNGGEM